MSLYLFIVKKVSYDIAYSWSMSMPLRMVSRTWCVRNSVSFSMLLGSTYPLYTSVREREGGRNETDLMV